MKNEKRLGRLFVRFETLEEKKKKTQKEILKIMRQDLKVKSIILNGIKGSWYLDRRIREAVARKILGKLFHQILVLRPAMEKIDDLKKRGIISHPDFRKIVGKTVRLRVTKVKVKK